MPTLPSQPGRSGLLAATVIMATVMGGWCEVLLIHETGRGTDTQAAWGYSLLPSTFPLTWDQARAACEASPGAMLARVEGWQAEAAVGEFLKEVHYTDPVWLANRQTLPEVLDEERREMNHVGVGVEGRVAVPPDLSMGGDVGVTLRCAVYRVGIGVVHELCSATTAAALCLQRLVSERPLSVECPSSPRRQWVLVNRETDTAAPEPPEPTLTVVALQPCHHRHIAKAQCSPQEGWQHAVCPLQDSAPPKHRKFPKKGRRGHQTPHRRDHLSRKQRPHPPQDTGEAVGDAVDSRYPHPKHMRIKRLAEMLNNPVSSREDSEHHDTDPAPDGTGMRTTGLNLDEIEDIMHTIPSLKKSTVGDQKRKAASEDKPKPTGDQTQNERKPAEDEKPQESQNQTGKNVDDSQKKTEPQSVITVKPEPSESVLSHPTGVKAQAEQTPRTDVSLVTLKDQVINNDKTNTRTYLPKDASDGKVQEGESQGEEKTKEPKEMTSRKEDKTVFTVGSGLIFVADAEPEESKTQATEAKDPAENIAPKDKETAPQNEDDVPEVKISIPEDEETEDEAEATRTEVENPQNEKGQEVSSWDAVGQEGQLPMNFPNAEQGRRPRFENMDEGPGGLDADTVNEGDRDMVGMNHSSADINKSTPKSPIMFPVTHDPLHQTDEETFMKDVTSTIPCPHAEDKEIVMPEPAVVPEEGPTADDTTVQADKNENTEEGVVASSIPCPDAKDGGTVVPEPAVTSEESSDLNVAVQVTEHESVDGMRPDGETVPQSPAISHGPTKQPAAEIESTVNPVLIDAGDTDTANEKPDMEEEPHTDEASDSVPESKPAEDNAEESGSQRDPKSEDFEDQPAHEDNPEINENEDKDTNEESNVEEAGAPQAETSDQMPVTENDESKGSESRPEPKSQDFENQSSMENHPKMNEDEDQGMAGENGDDDKGLVDENEDEDKEMTSENEDEDKGMAGEEGKEGEDEAKEGDETNKEKGTDMAGMGEEMDAATVVPNAEDMKDKLAPPVESRPDSMSEEEREEPAASSRRDTPRQGHKGLLAQIFQSLFG